ncbi:hypothetical protein [Butyrivibrio sp. VCB2001]|uniref:hypothetical protein n=1 Tax=Butyrivibrio sp. VCB2001 TaxID=1280667 RepID=UPI0004277AA4|nr:hypothetical protein [Butyrivibrio sp. VCB2001]
MNPKSQNNGYSNGTFVVKIEHCCNETWQGEVVWAEENRKEKFRSTLELIRLMDEAMQISKGQQEEFQHFNIG